MFTSTQGPSPAYQVLFTVLRRPQNETDRGSWRRSRLWCPTPESHGRRGQIPEICSYLSELQTSHLVSIPVGVACKNTDIPLPDVSSIRNRWRSNPYFSSYMTSVITFNEARCPCTQFLRITDLHQPGERDRRCIATIPGTDSISKVNDLPLENSS